jgi:hypothetical protein
LAAENLNVSVSHIYQSNRGVNGATWAREDIAAAFAEHISREFHDHALDVFLKYKRGGRQLRRLPI